MSVRGQCNADWSFKATNNSRKLHIGAGFMLHPRLSDRANSAHSAGGCQPLAQCSQARFMNNSWRRKPDNGLFSPLPGCGELTAPFIGTVIVEASYAEDQGYLRSGFQSRSIAVLIFSMQPRYMPNGWKFNIFLEHDVNTASTCFPTDHILRKPAKKTHIASSTHPGN